MRELRGVLAALVLSVSLLITGAVSASADGADPAPRAPQRTVTPAAVQFDEWDDSFYIPSTTGVEYVFEGEVLASEWYYAEGKITITARARSGYTLSGTTRWTHTFTHKASHPFIDVRAGSQHEEAIDYMYWAGLSTGWKTSRGPEYRPHAAVNRDAMAAFLYRLAGEPDVTLPKKSPFTDMGPRTQHYEAVIWAYQEGITTGWALPNGTVQFRPTQPIARDAMAAFLYRFDGAPRFPAPTKSCFQDVRPSATFAKEICWMKSEGITTGYTDGTYRPLVSVKRDGMAAFIYRYATAS